MRSSEVSSITTMRSDSRMKSVSAFSSVVLPLPVPPLMRMVLPDAINSLRKSASGGVSAPPVSAAAAYSARERTCEWWRTGMDGRLEG